MNVYEITLTDGRVFDVESDTPPTEADVLQFIAQQGGGGSPPATQPPTAQAPAATPGSPTPADERGILSQFGTTLSTGTRTALNSLDILNEATFGDNEGLASAIGDQSAINQEIAANRSAADIRFEEDLARTNEAIKADPSTLGQVMKFASGFGSAVMQEPVAALKMAAQSLPNVVVAAPIQAVGRLAGAAIGAAAGLPTTGPGAIATGIAGAITAGALINSMLESGPEIYAAINEKSGGALANMTQQQRVAFLDANPELAKEGLMTGLKRGAAIGTVEGIGGAFAGRLTTGAQRAAVAATEKTAVQLAAKAGVNTASKEAMSAFTANPAVRQVLDTAYSAAEKAAKPTALVGGARKVAAGGIEAGSATVGELSAQTVAGQEVDFAEAFAETLGELAGAPLSVAVDTYAELRSQPGRRVIEDRVNRNIASASNTNEDLGNTETAAALREVGAATPLTAAAKDPEDFAMPRTAALNTLASMNDTLEEGIVQLETLGPNISEDDAKQLEELKLRQAAIASAFNNLYDTDSRDDAAAAIAEDLNRQGQNIGNVRIDDDPPAATTAAPTATAATTAAPTATAAAAAAPAATTAAPTVTAATTAAPTATAATTAAPTATAAAAPAATTAAPTPTAAATTATPTATAAAAPAATTATPTAAPTTETWETSPEFQSAQTLTLQGYPDLASSLEREWRKSRPAPTQATTPTANVPATAAPTAANKPAAKASSKTSTQATAGAKPKSTPSGGVAPAATPAVTPKSPATSEAAAPSAKLKDKSPRRDNADLKSLDTLELHYYGQIVNENKDEKEIERVRKHMESRNAGRKANNLTEEFDTAKVEATPAGIAQYKKGHTAANKRRKGAANKTELPAKDDVKSRMAAFSVLDEQAGLSNVRVLTPKAGSVDEESGTAVVLSGDYDGPKTEITVDLDTLRSEMVRRNGQYTQFVAYDVDNLKTTEEYDKHIADSRAKLEAKRASPVTVPTKADNKKLTKKEREAMEDANKVAGVARASVPHIKPTPQYIKDAMGADAPPYLLVIGDHSKLDDPSLIYFMGGVEPKSERKKKKTKAEKFAQKNKEVELLARKGGAEDKMTVVRLFATEQGMISSVTARPNERSNKDRILSIGTGKLVYITPFYRASLTDPSVRDVTQPNVRYTQEVEDKMVAMMEAVNLRRKGSAPTTQADMTAAEAKVESAVQKLFSSLGATPTPAPATPAATLEEAPPELQEALEAAVTKAVEEVPPATTVEPAPPVIDTAYLAALMAGGVSGVAPVSTNENTEVEIESANQLPDTASIDDIKQAAPISLANAAAAAASSESKSKWLEWMRENLSHLMRFTEKIWKQATATVALVSVLISPSGTKASSSTDVTAQEYSVSEQVARPATFGNIAPWVTAQKPPVKAAVNNLDGYPEIGLPETSNTGGEVILNLSEIGGSETRFRQTPLQEAKLAAKRVEGEATMAMLSKRSAKYFLNQGSSQNVDALAEMLYEKESTSPKIAKMLRDMGIQESPDTFPWCATSVSYALTRSGNPSSITSARSFLGFGKTKKNPSYGDLVVMWNTNPATGGRSGWGGHVGFYLGEVDGAIAVLSGNVNDEVNVSLYSKSRVLAYRDVSDRGQVKQARPLLTARNVTKLNRSGTTGGFLNNDIINEGFDLLAKGITDFAAWGAGMIRKFGKAIVNYLEDVWMLVLARRGSVGGNVGANLKPSRRPAPDPEALSGIMAAAEAMNDTGMYRFSEFAQYLYEQGGGIENLWARLRPHLLDGWNMVAVARKDGTLNTARMELVPDEQGAQILETIDAGGDPTFIPVVQEPTEVSDPTEDGKHYLADAYTPGDKRRMFKLPEFPGLVLLLEVEHVIDSDTEQIVGNYVVFTAREAKTKATGRLRWEYSSAPVARLPDGSLYRYPELIGPSDTDLMDWVDKHKAILKSPAQIKSREAFAKQRSYLTDISNEIKLVTESPATYTEEINGRKVTFSVVPVYDPKGQPGPRNPAEREEARKSEIRSTKKAALEAYNAREWDYAEDEDGDPESTDGILGEEEEDEADSDEGVTQTKAPSASQYIPLHMVVTRLRDGRKKFGQDARGEVAAFGDKVLNTWMTLSEDSKERLESGTLTEGETNAMFQYNHWRVKNFMADVDKSAQSVPGYDAQSDSLMRVVDDALVALAETEKFKTLTNKLRDKPSPAAKKNLTQEIASMKQSAVREAEAAWVSRNPNTAKILIDRMARVTPSGASPDSMLVDTSGTQFFQEFGLAPFPYESVVGEVFPVGKRVKYYLITAISEDGHIFKSEYADAVSPVIVRRDTTAQFTAGFYTGLRGMRKQGSLGLFGPNVVQVVEDAVAYFKAIPEGQLPKTRTPLQPKSVRDSIMARLQFVKAEAARVIKEAIAAGTYVDPESGPTVTQQLPATTLAQIIDEAKAPGFETGRPAYAGLGWNKRPQEILDAAAKLVGEAALEQANADVAAVEAQIAYDTAVDELDTERAIYGLPPQRDNKMKSDAAQKVDELKKKVDLAEQAKLTASRNLADIKAQLDPVVWEARHESRVADIRAQAASVMTGVVDMLTKYNSKATVKDIHAENIRRRKDASAAVRAFSKSPEGVKFYTLLRDAKPEHRGGNFQLFRPGKEAGNVDNPPNEQVLAFLQYRDELANNVLYNAATTGIETLRAFDRQMRSKFIEFVNSPVGYEQILGMQTPARKIKRPPAYVLYQADVHHSGATPGSTARFLRKFAPNVSQKEIGGRPGEKKFPGKWVAWAERDLSTEPMPELTSEQRDSLLGTPAMSFIASVKGSEALGMAALSGWAYADYTAVNNSVVWNAESKRWQIINADLLRSGLTTAKRALIDSNLINQGKTPEEQDERDRKLEEEAEEKVRGKKITVLPGDRVGVVRNFFNTYQMLPIYRVFGVALNFSGNAENWNDAIDQFAKESNAAELLRKTYPMASAAGYKVENKISSFHQIKVPVMLPNAKGKSPVLRFTNDPVTTHAQIAFIYDPETGGSGTFTEIPVPLNLVREGKVHPAISVAVRRVGTDKDGAPIENAYVTGVTHPYFMDAKKQPIFIPASSREAAIEAMKSSPFFMRQVSDRQREPKLLSAYQSAYNSVEEFEMVAQNEAGEVFPATNEVLLNGARTSGEKLLNSDSRAQNLTPKQRDIVLENFTYEFVFRLKLHAMQQELVDKMRAAGIKVSEEGGYDALGQWRLHEFSPQDIRQSSFIDEAMKEWFPTMNLLGGLKLEGKGKGPKSSDKESDAVIDNLVNEAIKSRRRHDSSIDKMSRDELAELRADMARSIRGSVSKFRANYTALKGKLMEREHVNPSPAKTMESVFRASVGEDSLYFSPLEVSSDVMPRINPHAQTNDDEAQYALSIVEAAMESVPEETVADGEVIEEVIGSANPLAKLDQMDAYFKRLNLRNYFKGLPAYAAVVRLTDEDTGSLASASRLLDKVERFRSDAFNYVRDDPYSLAVVTNPNTTIKNIIRELGKFAVKYKKAPPDFLRQATLALMSDNPVFAQDLGARARGFPSVGNNVRIDVWEQLFKRLPALMTVSVVSFNDTTEVGTYMAIDPANPTVLKVDPKRVGKWLSGRKSAAAIELLDKALRHEMWHTNTILSLGNNFLNFADSLTDEEAIDIAQQYLPESATPEQLDAFTENKANVAAEYLRMVLELAESGATTEQVEDFLNTNPSLFAIAIEYLRRFARRLSAHIQLIWSPELRKAYDDVTNFASALENSADANEAAGLGRVGHRAWHFTGDLAARKKKNVSQAFDYEEPDYEGMLGDDADAFASGPSKPKVKTSGWITPDGTILENSAIALYSLDNMSEHYTSMMEYLVNEQPKWHAEYLAMRDWERMDPLSAVYEFAKRKGFTRVVKFAGELSYVPPYKTNNTHLSLLMTSAIESENMLVEDRGGAAYTVKYTPPVFGGDLGARARTRAPTEAKLPSKVIEIGDRIKPNHNYWILPGDRLVDVREEGFDDSGDGVWSHGRFVRSWIKFTMKGGPSLNPKEYANAAKMLARAKEITKTELDPTRFTNRSEAEYDVDTGEFVEPEETPNIEYLDLAYVQAAQEQGWVRIKETSIANDSVMFVETKGPIKSSTVRQVLEHLQYTRGFVVEHTTGGALSAGVVATKGPSMLNFFREGNTAETFGASPQRAKGVTPASVTSVEQEDALNLARELAPEGYEVVTGLNPGSPDSPMFVHSTTPSVIYVNPAALAFEIGGVTPSQQRTIVEALLAHETAHLDAEMALTDEELLSIHAEMTDDQVVQTMADYLTFEDDRDMLLKHAGRGPLAADMTEQQRMVAGKQFAHEFLRMTRERIEKGATSEEIIAFAHSNPTILRRVVQYFRNLINRYRARRDLKNNPRIQRFVGRMMEVQDDMVLDFFPEDAGNSLEPTTLGASPARLGLKFTHSSDNSGFSDVGLSSIDATLNGVYMGSVSYDVAGGAILVNSIYTKPEFRRQGVATAMANELQASYPGKKIKWGKGTESGAPFVKSLEGAAPAGVKLRPGMKPTVVEDQEDKLRVVYDRVGEFGKGVNAAVLDAEEFIANKIKNKEDLVLFRGVYKRITSWKNGVRRGEPGMPRRGYFWTPQLSVAEEYAGFNDGEDGAGRMPQGLMIVVPWQELVGVEAGEQEPNLTELDKRGKIYALHQGLIDGEEWEFVVPRSFVNKARMYNVNSLISFDEFDDETNDNGKERIERALIKHYFRGPDAVKAYEDAYGVVYARPSEVASGTIPTKLDATLSAAPVRWGLFFNRNRVIMAPNSTNVVFTAERPTNAAGIGFDKKTQDLYDRSIASIRASEVEVNNLHRELMRAAGKKYTEGLLQQAIGDLENKYSQADLDYITSIEDQGRLTRRQAFASALGQSQQLRLAGDVQGAAYVIDQARKANQAAIVQQQAAIDAYRLKVTDQYYIDAQARIDAARVSLDKNTLAKVMDIRNAIDAMTTKMQQSGFLSPEMQIRFDKSKGIYMHRMYYMYRDRKGWLDYLSTGDERQNIGNQDAITIKMGARRFFLEEVIKDKAAGLMKILPGLSKQTAIARARQVTDEFSPEVDEMFNDSLDMMDNSEFAALDMGGGNLARRSSALIKQRGEVPNELQALWGVVKSGTGAFTGTIAAQSTWLAKTEFQTQLAKHGIANGFFRTKPDPLGKFVPIVADTSENRRKYPAFFFNVATKKPLTSPGGIQGVGLKRAPVGSPYYVPAILRTALDDVSGPHQESQIYSWLKRLTGWSMAAKTIGEIPRGYIRNLLGNALFSASNATAFGGSSPRKNYRDALLTMLASPLHLPALTDTLNKIGMSKFDTRHYQQMYRDLVERRVVSDSFTRGLIQELLLSDLVEIMAPNNNRGLQYLKNLKARGDKLVKKASDVYGAMDDVWKVLAYNVELDRIRNEKYLTQGANESALEFSERQKDRASYKVRKTMITMSEISALGKSFRGQPFIGPFIGFTMEVWRVVIDTAKLGLEEMSKGNAAEKRMGALRLMGLLVVTSAAPLIIRAVTNIGGDDEDDELTKVWNAQRDEDVRRVVPEWQKENELVVIPSKDGTVRYLDISYMLPHDVVTGAITRAFETLQDEELQGFDKGLETLSAAFGAASGPFSKGQIFLTSVAEAFTGVNTGTKFRVWDNYDSSLTRTIKAAKHVGNALTPGVAKLPGRWIDAATGKVDSSGEEKTIPNEFANTFLGMSARTLKLGQILERRAKQYKDVLGEASMKASYPMKTQGTVSDADIKKGVQQMYDLRKQTLASARKDYIAFVRLGLTKGRAIAALRVSGGFSESESRQIVANKMLRYDLPDDTLKTAMINGRARKQNRIGAYRAAQSDIPVTAPLTVE